MSSPAGRKPSRALVGVLVLAAGLTGGIAGVTAASGAGGNHAVRADLGYSCRLASSAYQISAVITATFPASAAAGTPIQPADLQLTVTLPQQAVAYLRSLGAVTVTASGSLAVTATSGSNPAPATWPVRTASAAAIPAAGSLTLRTSGTAPPAVARAPGTVTFAATGLTLVLAPHSAGGASTSPATVQGSCTTSSGASTRLASVSVTAATPAASSSTPSAGGAAGPATKPAAKHRFPKGCGHIKVHGGGQAVCGYLKGFSDVKKVYGATRLGPVLVNIDFAYRTVIRHHELIAYSSGRIDNNGKPDFPPVRATFLGFGFVPVTATLSVVERGPISIVSVSGITKPPYPITVTAKSRVTISVSHVTVNGTPLPVGAGCRAAHAARLTLVGHGTNTFPPHGYTVPTGGPLSGTLTIPRFIHCGVTENLDVLLTGSISGPGNFAKMTQGKLCGPAQPAVWTCPPPTPKPIR